MGKEKVRRSYAWRAHSWRTHASHLAEQSAHISLPCRQSRPSFLATADNISHQQQIDLSNVDFVGARRPDISGVGTWDVDSLRIPVTAVRKKLKSKVGVWAVDFLNLYGFWDVDFVQLGSRISVVHHKLT